MSFRKISPIDLKLLNRWCNAVRGRYGYPIFLCGSALQKKNPRDWDIRIMVSNFDFWRMFGLACEWEEQGTTGKWDDVRWKWSDECVKQSRNGFHHTHLNIDFQVYPEKYAKKMYGGKPKRRMDTRA